MRESLIQLFFLGFAVSCSLYFYYAWQISKKNDLSSTRSRKSGGGAKKASQQKT